MQYDVAVIGAGIAGMASAARLQAAGLSTLVLESHGHPGGCSGYYRRKGFAFDVGATTLVDFAPGGVGGELLQSIGMPPLSGDHLPGYVAWLPDRSVTLHRDHASWSRERLRTLGDSPSHRAFWTLLDRLASVFWNASRQGVKFPIQNPVDALRALQAVGFANLPLTRYVSWTLLDALRLFGLEHDRPLVSLLSMLVEDTVHARVSDAPLINASLGITIRGAGLTRAPGGMFGFWTRFTAHYRALGGILRVGCPVDSVSGREGDFRLSTRRGAFSARQVVAAIPAEIAVRLGPPPVARALRPYIQRDSASLGGALVVFLGVPDHEVESQPWTHHQLMHDYDAPLGNGNNMFLSVSSPGDLASAPAAHRAVMISTHCDLSPWEGLSPSAYQARKQTAGERLIALARRAYPDLGKSPVVLEIATPRTYERFTRRPRGAVGGARQTLSNANQHAIPHDLGVPGFWLVGDRTWPGLGTVACCLGSRLVAEGVLARSRRPARRFAGPSHRPDRSLFQFAEVQPRRVL
jgi:C-3',4' desaturase CrtD